MKRDHTRLTQALAEDYVRRSPRSTAFQERAQRVMVDGGSHNPRLVWPFPPRIVSARGGWFQDEDGHDILDLWQGHFANVLGHNPEVVTTALAASFRSGWGLLSGMTDVLQIEVAEILCRQTGCERVRFTTSGSLATMYAILLARAFTGRRLVLKVGGGWHGAQPWGLKGVEFRQGYEQPDSEGLSPEQIADIHVTRFNDVETLQQAFRRLGDRLACFIVEPFIGAGGFIPARREYLQEARRLTEHYGVVLIFDEIISGFRFRAGDAGALYGIRPDLATFGKAMGGGMPMAAVAGRADILELAGRGSGRVRFSGGTYSAHPASMLAARVMMTYLVEHEAEIYPRLAELGEKARRTMEAAFVEEGIYARCSGSSEALPGSSLVKLHFPYREDMPLESPDEVHNPDICDDVLAEKVVRLALLLEDVHTVHGGGALSTAHTEEDIAFLGEACRRAARRIKAYL